MPSLLRSRAAIAVLLGVFLIPIGLSSLRGLSHILTCQQEVASPFTVVVDEDGSAVVVSSTRVEASEETGVCGGLVVDLRARPGEPGRMTMTVELANRGEYPWIGTVDLALNGNSFPVRIGRVAPGESEEDTIVFRLDPGSHEIGGLLLVGP